MNGNSDFEVNVLLDCTRGSRGTYNSRSMLRPLLAEFTSVRVSLFHTPDLRGFLKKIIPDRFNETIGLTHVKVYLFDDSFIISGANLSNDYFTNRQDRYLLFNNCCKLANFFSDFVKTIMSFSLRLAPDNSLHLAPDWKIHPYKGNKLQFKLKARETIESFLKGAETFQNIKSVVEQGNTEPKGKNLLQEPESDRQLGDTVIYPLVQMGPFGVIHDEQALQCLLRVSNHHDRILLASGYFNLTDYYMSVILNQSLAKFSILMASPQSNGFLGAKGIAGAIPYSYVYLARKFLKQVQRVHQNQRIQMMEYVRDGWTFHGKGLWYYLPSQSLPSLTLVGSPNFGYRSVYRDLECQVALVTENKGLREQLREEHVRMFSSSQLVTEQTFQRRDRYVPMWIRVVTSFITKFF
uniref:CDP-diacylglycerol--glycerol-3-phosphate 3-phosphatidyltransferase n=1 Tax=Arion vulgaris TaxID=1028688 RepID=A0A0B7A5S7_9EUPU